MAGRKITKGVKVRLLCDITTRGNVKFRKGLVMRVSWAHRGMDLEVRVRAKWHFVRLKKKDAWMLAVIAPAPEDDDGHNAA